MQKHQTNKRRRTESRNLCNNFTLFPTWCCTCDTEHSCWADCTGQAVGMPGQTDSRRTNYIANRSSRIYSIRLNCVFCSAHYLISPQSSRPLQVHRTGVRIVESASVRLQDFRVCDLVSSEENASATTLEVFSAEINGTWILLHLSTGQVCRHKHLW
jgi:hypothetical protein